MIGVFLTFRYAEDFDEQAVRGIADAAQERFKGMAGLRSKAFTVNPAKREAVNSFQGKFLEDGFRSGDGHDLGTD